METQTRQLLQLLSDDLTDRLIQILADGPVLETTLQDHLPESRQTITRRLRELAQEGIADCAIRATPGRGRSTDEWWLVDDWVLRFGDVADGLVLDHLEARAKRHRAGIAARSRQRVTSPRSERSAGSG